MTDSLTSSFATPGGRATIVAAGMGYPNRSGRSCPAFGFSTRVAG